MVPDTGNPTSCLTVNAGQGLITLQECSTVDDVSQTTQWWQITRDNTSNEPANVTFLGNITYTSYPKAGFYSTGYGYLGGNEVVSGETSSAFEQILGLIHFVTAIYHNELNPRSDYQIKLLANE